MIAPKSRLGVPAVVAYQAIAFVALLATIYVLTPEGLRWKVMAISAVFGLAAAFATGRLYRDRDGDRGMNDS